MKKYLYISIGVFALMLGLVSIIGPQVAYADGVDVFNTACRDANSRNSELCRTTPLFGSGDSLWGRIINTLTFVIGAVAVIMIIIGGIKYVLSNGDQSAITSAKNTILYSVVGLVVAIMASAIVNFVIRAI